jgi:predicted acyltransferase
MAEQSPAEEFERAPAPVAADLAAGGGAKPARLVSLDAYRGFIMVMLAAAGFGIARLAQLPADAPVWQTLDYGWWQGLRSQFEHPEWVSRFGWMGVAFWDLIQPAFMFMVGVAMPYSYARRESLGHSRWQRLGHAVWRGLVLVLLGVFLQSQSTSQTNWMFANVLAQIGLGYVFVYLLLGRRWMVQAAAFAAILIGYWFFFFSYTPPAGYGYAAVKATEEAVFEGRFASWSKNANAGHQFDRWFLNQFPRPNDEEFQYNPGGYLTLNFVPSIATMLLGVFCGQLLLSGRKPWQKFGILVAGGAACMLLALLAAEYACPVVKRIWTPSWVLFSGAYVIWMLAGFYLVFDLLPLKWLAFPLVVVGMNSLAMYLMGQLLRPWAIKTVHTHFDELLESVLGSRALADDMFGRLLEPTAALVVFWLIAFWLYRQRLFIRV